jgi:hypothetical protein
MTTDTQKAEKLLKIHRISDLHGNMQGAHPRAGILGKVAATRRLHENNNHDSGTTHNCSDGVGSVCVGVSEILSAPTRQPN